MDSLHVHILSIECVLFVCCLLFVVYCLLFICHCLQLIQEASKYNIVLFPWLSICLRRRQECVTTYLENERKRRERIYKEQDAFEEQILQVKLV